jgi:hypothetical protein
VTARAYRDAGFACVRPWLDVMPADLGLSAGLPGSARPLRMSHVSCEQAARPSPGDAPVQVYDIKWPSVRSSFVQLPFTYAAYQWARAAKTLLTAWRSKTGEAMVSLDAGKAQPPFGGSRADKPAMAVTVAADATVHHHPVRCADRQDQQIAKIRG